MKRIILIALGLYLLIAVANKAAEAAGAMTCGCADDCWCKLPGLSVFRWVFPWGHRSAHTSHEKAELDHQES
jgi:hypothetical protein